MQKYRLKILTVFLLTLFFSTRISAIIAGDKKLNTNKSIDTALFSNAAQRIIKKQILNSKKNNCDTCVIAGLYKLGLLYRNQNRLDSSGICFYKGLELTENVPGNHYKARLLTAIGDLERSTGDYKNSIIHLFKAIEFSAKKKRFTSLSTAYNRLAATCYEIYTGGPVERYKFDKTLRSSCINFADTSKIQWIEAVKIYTDSSVHYSNLSNDRRNDSENQNLYGSYYRSKGQFEKALVCFKKAIQIAKERNSLHEIPNFTANISFTYLSQKNYKNAIESAKIALIDAKKNKQEGVILLSSIILYRSYIEIKDFKNALYYNSIVDSTSLKLLNEKSRILQNELAEKYEAEKRNRQIYELKQQNEFSEKLRNRMVFILIFSVLSAFLAIIIFFLRWKNAKQQAMISTKEATLNEAKLQKATLELQNNELEMARTALELKNKELELQNKELKEKELQYQLDITKQEITSKSLQIAQKNEFLAAAIENLKKFSGENASADQQKSIRSLITGFKANLHENYWAEFEASFEQVHVDFYKNIEAKYPNLTLNERKLCALIRLNLSTKEISLITQQTIAALEQARYRLRKKMNLSPEANLSSILSSF